MPSMALHRGDVADAAMAVFMVVPMDGARLDGNSGRYFTVRNTASAKALSKLVGFVATAFRLR